MNKVTAYLILDKRKIKKSGEYPVRIRITHKRVQKYFGCDCALTPEQYEQVWLKDAKSTDKDVQNYLFEKLVKVNNIIDDMRVFSFDELKQKLLYDTVSRFHIKKVFLMNVFTIPNKNYLKKVINLKLK